MRWIFEAEFIGLNFELGFFQSNHILFDLFNRYGISIELIKKDVNKHTKCFLLNPIFFLKMNNHFLLILSL